MKKTFFRFLISFIVISILLSPVFAFGYTKRGEGEATLLQEGEYDIVFETKNDYSEPTRNTVSAEEYIYNALIGCSSDLDFTRTSYSIPVDDASAIYSNVINDNADLFYVSSSYGYSYYPSTNTIAHIYPKYAMSSGEINAAKAVFNSGVQKALSVVDNSMNDLQKALTIHEYICNQAIYPVISGGNDRDVYHSAYGFFLDNNIVCAGYTLTYSYLLHQLNIPCVYVASDSMEHAWNKVYIDGNWYNVDATFDDFNYGSGQNTYGAITHSYFMKSDAYFSNNDIVHGHFGGSTVADCTANDTTYDNAFWDNVTSRIYVLDGDFYYLKPSSNYYNAYLKKRTISGNEVTVGSGFNTSYLNYSNTFLDENGNQHTIRFSDCLARLTYLDNRFYVTANEKIYSLFTNGKRYIIMTLENDASGISENEKGNIIYHVYGDDNILQELDKYAYFKLHFTKQKGKRYNNYPDVNDDSVINGKDYSIILKQKNN